MEGDRLICVDLLYHTMNEVDSIFSMDAAKAMETNLIYTPSIEGKGAYFNIRQDVFKVNGYWLCTTPDAFLLRSINGKSAEDCRRVRKLYNVLKIVNREAATNLYNSPMITLVIFDHAFRNSGKTYALKKIEKLAETGYVPAIHRLIQYRTVSKTTIFCNLERLHQTGNATKDETHRLGRYYFWGLSPVQSYEKAMELGVSPDLCLARSEHADFHLLIPISLMYMYFTKAQRFLLSLRLVCKSWNHKIQRSNLFWTRLFGEGKIYQTVICEKERVYFARVQHRIGEKKKELKSVQTKLKSKKTRRVTLKREIKELESQISKDSAGIEELESELKRMKQ